MSQYSMTAGLILHPQHFTHPRDVGTAPAVAGLYGWWFRAGSLDIPDADYTHSEGFELLYTGISPRRPTPNGTASKGTIRRRLKAHASSDASRSTLRRTLGTLLTEPLDLTLGIYSGRAHYGTGEARITHWLHENAMVCWTPATEPWLVEDELLAHTPLALNISGRHDNFSALLSKRRSDALRQAVEA